MRKDCGEQHNVAKENAKVVKKLEQMLQEELAK